MEWWMERLSPVPVSSPSWPRRRPSTTNRNRYCVGDEARPRRNSIVPRAEHCLGPGLGRDDERACAAVLSAWIPSGLALTFTSWPRRRLSTTNGNQRSVGVEGASQSSPHSMAGLDPAIQSHTLQRLRTLHWMAASEGGHDERAEITLAVLKVRPLLRALTEGCSRTRAAHRCHRAPSHRDVRDEASCRARGPFR